MRRLVLVFVGACTAAPEPRASVVDAETVIAVSIRRAEVDPGEIVAARVWVATPDGPGDASGAAWARCVSPRPVTDNNAVAVACLGDGAEAVGEGASVSIALSDDACSLFGPDPPPGGFRPRDPDPSGGYYQPLRVEVGDLVAFGMARVHCLLANAPLDVSLRYQDEYRDNVAPLLDALELDGDQLTVRWPDSTLEPYLRYDVASEALVRDVEVVTVSWFVTDGEVALDRTLGGATGARVTWTGAAGHAWAVVRDDRGGVAVAHLEL